MTLYMYMYVYVHTVSPSILSHEESEAPAS